MERPARRRAPAGRSYDYTGTLSASTWRHVRFVETVTIPDAPAPTLNLVEAALGAVLDRWVFMSDVCKHCTNAGCLDACPTGALIRTEFETVIVQPDVCNGCGYCVAVVPVRRHQPRPLRRPRREVHALLRPARGRPRAGVREGVPDRLDPVRAATTSWSSGPRGAWRRCTSAGWRAPTSTARATSRASSSRAASARSSCSPSRPSASACPPRPTRRSRRTARRPRRPGSPPRSSPSAVTVARLASRTEGQR